MSRHDNYDDDTLRHIFASVRTIAVVGASANPRRPSWGVLHFLLARGYRVVAINPGLASDAIMSVVTYARLADVPEPIDMIDVFRNNDAVEGVVTEALALDPHPKVIWMQLGVRVDAEAARAEAAGIEVVMDRCPAIEIPRLAA